MPAAKYTLKNPLERLRFKQSLAGLNGVSWQEKPEQYCDYRLDGKNGGNWLRAKQFTNGTLYLEASDDPSLASMTELLSIQPVTTTSGGSSTGSGKVSGQLDITGAYFGTDESGKGDYFGPLVIAGVRVDDKSVKILNELGVCDSKKLTDKQIKELATQIIQVVTEEAISVIELGPKKYNELYDRFKQNGKNLNHMLAWGHATVIENLCERFPDCTQAVADQFGNERYILSQLKDKGKLIKLHQTPRAEANTGVAAASIIARNQFVKKMYSLSNQYGVDLPMGANPRVKTQARLFIEEHGRDALANVAKLHFKTTQEL